MNPPPNREVALFCAALELPAGQRAAYLAGACADDPALRLRLEALLRVHQDAITFLENTATGAQESPMGPEVSDASMRLSSSPAEKAGDRIGRYKLLQQIGEGGCGVVYMAEQEEPVRRRLALKVIKLGMDTKQVIARFEAERQALALMDHPNIAKVLDAGATDTGRPYFVMELVRGTKITDYCDENNLSTEQRLDLFIQVCQAIQHAHQKGIIHRDIKPSNILVADHDGVPVPKVIDFGVAKATTDQRLTDKTLFTAFEQFIGTPAYMSPEQAKLSGLDIDTRTDIYSLGVLLYELLTGKTPLDQKELLAAGLDEMRRTIREQEPASPSTRLKTMLAGELTTTAKQRRTEAPKLVHLLRGDLDWIVMKTLEKDRARRYDTANGLAMDIQRHLNNEPVVARPPSNLYRFQKLVRRNKLAFAAAGAVAAALMVGLAVSTVLLLKESEGRRRAVAAENKAQAAAVKSQQVADLLKKMLKSVGPSVARGRDSTMLREILDETASSMGQDLTNHPDVEVELCLTLADTHYDLGLYKQMEVMARRSLQVARTRLGEENGSVANSLITLGHGLLKVGQERLGGMQHRNLEETEKVSRLQDSTLQEAEKCCREGLAMSRKLLGNENTNVARALRLLAEVLLTQSRAAEAEKLNCEALAMYKKLLGAEHPDIAKVLMDLAETLACQDDSRLPEAERISNEALTMLRKLLGNDHPDVAKSLFVLSSVQALEGKFAEAETTCREAVATWRALQATNRMELAAALANLAYFLREQGKLVEAELQQREALRLQRKLFGDQQKDVAQSLARLAIILQRQGKLEEAERLYWEALPMLRSRLGSEHRSVADVLSGLAGALAEQGKLQAAEPLLREALSLERKIHAEDCLRVAYALNNLGYNLAQQGKLAGAETTLREAVAMHRRLSGTNHVELVRPLDNLAHLLQREGKLAEAETAFREDLAAQIELLGNEHVIVARLLTCLGNSLEKQNQLGEAETTYRQALAMQQKLQGPNHVEVACALNNLGYVLMRRDKLAEAETTLRDAVAMHGRPSADKQVELARPLGNLRTNLQTYLWDGNEQVELARSLDNLANLLLREGKLAEAETAYREDLVAQRKLPGIEDAVVARVLDRLAEVLEKQRKPAEAETLYRDAAERGNAQAMNEFAWRLATSTDAKLRDGSNAVSYAEKASTATSRTNASYLDTLAAAYAEMSQFEKAVTVQNEAIALLRNEEERKDYTSRLRLYESKIPYRDSAALASRASALLDAGKFAEAEPLARACLALREKQIPDDWRTFSIRSELGGSLLSQKKYAEAEPLLLSGYEGMKQCENGIPTEGKPRLMEALQRLVQLYKATNRPDQAAEWKQKLELVSGERERVSPGQTIASPEQR